MRALCLTVILSLSLLAGCASQSPAQVAMSIPPAQTDALESSLPAPVREALAASRKEQGAKAVAVGPETYVVITAGNLPGASLPIVEILQEGDTVRVMYDIQPLTGINSSTTTLEPYPFNVVNIGKVDSSKVTLHQINHPGPAGK